MDDFSAILLAGGHCPDIRPYLENTLLHALVAGFNEQKKSIAAICHGVILAARSGVLHQRKVTALPEWMESLAFNLTRIWMGSYYKTYPNISVEAEVAAAAHEFVAGPYSFARDCPDNLRAGFVVQDENIITARWPGDAHAFANAILLDRLAA